MALGWLGLPWWVWVAGAAVVGLAFTRVYPRAQFAAAAGAGQRFALRWGHALVWALLALSFVVRAVMPLRGAGAAGAITLTALAVYVWFLASLLRK